MFYVLLLITIILLNFIYIDSHKNLPKKRPIALFWQSGLCNFTNHGYPLVIFYSAVALDFFNPIQKKINKNLYPLLSKRRSALGTPRGFYRDAAKTVGALFGG